MTLIRKLYFLLFCLCFLLVLNSVLAQEPPPTETPVLTETVTETATASITPSETATASATEIGTATATLTETTTPTSTTLATATYTETITETLTPTLPQSPSATETAFTSTPESLYIPESLATMTLPIQIPRSTPPSSPPTIPFLSPNSYLTLNEAVVDPIDDDLLITVFEYLRLGLLNEPFTLYLLAGNYRLSQAIQVFGDIRIYGRGVDVTFIEKGPTVTQQFAMFAMFANVYFNLNSVTIHNIQNIGLCSIIIFLYNIKIK